MTVITKTSLTVKKTPLVVENGCTEEVIDIHPSAQAGRPSKRYKGVILCTGIIAALLLLLGVITAMQIYEQVMNDVQRHNRYKGFCSIPIPRDLQLMEQRKTPLLWTSTTNDNPDQLDTDVQVVSFMEDNDEMLDTLREILDINVDDGFEKISVVNNGNRVSFLHDFENNITGIVDSARCFTAPLDPARALAPAAFVLGLQRGAPFDVSRARSALRAVLRPLAELGAPAGSPLAALCRGRPVYPLEQDDELPVRKRSVDAPPHDYIQFAGKHIQEIQISNLAEVLEYEQKNKLLA